MHLEPLSTRPEIAELLRVSPGYLAHAAMKGEGPPFVRVGRAVRYDKAAVAAWLAEQARAPQAA